MRPFPLVIFDALLVHSEPAIFRNISCKGLVVTHLSIAICLSSSFKNLARTGESGMKTLSSHQRSGLVSV